MRQLRLPTVLSRADLATAVFGGWDGCISVLAVLIAARHAPARVLLAAGLGGAIGGMFSMATGQYESMTRTQPRVREAVVMGACTLAGGLIPAFPFFVVSRTAAFAVALAGTWAFATGVWILKKEGIAGALRTYLLLAVTVAATVGVSIVLP